MNQLSQDALNKIEHWKSYRNPEALLLRPSWDELFYNIALNVAERSPDAQTKCGTVLVNQHNEIVSTGYNGVIRGIRDDVLPNLRPAKYDFMLHAEINSVLACARQGKSTLGLKAYITGPPCNSCLQMMIQAGISEVIHGDSNIAMLTNDPDYKVTQEILLWLAKDQITMRGINV